MLYKTPTFLKNIYPKLIWDNLNGEDQIALTFDDGPIPEVTEFVLKELKRYQLKATFFCIGDNIKKHPKVFEKIIAQGHSIGNHTMHHLNGWKTSAKDYLENIELCQVEIEKYLPNQKNKFFRPPFGRIKRSQIKKIEKEYDIVMWSTLSQDYRQDLKPDNCLKRTLQASKKNSIVVFHDSLKAKRNLEYVLPKYLKEISSKF